MAYVILHAFREKCLKNTQFAKAQFDTIRLLFWFLIEQEVSIQ